MGSPAEMSVEGAHNTWSQWPNGSMLEYSLQPVV